MIRRARWAALLAIFVLAACAPPAGGFALRTGLAEEPVDQFLAALRERRLFDEAIDYLKLLPSNEHLPDAMRQRALYEQGITFLAIAAGQNDPQIRDTQLARAAEMFEQFRRSFPQHPLAATAKHQIANVLIERAREEILVATDRGTRQAALPQARKLLEQARAEFSQAEQELDGQLQKLPKLVAPDQTDLKSQKQQLSGDLAQSRLERASIDYELATTFESGSSEAKKHLEAAATSYAKLYEMYRTRSAGLLARLWEGRCYQEMGQTKAALGCYQELMDLPAARETRSIKAKGTRQAFECWINSGEKKYQEVIERGERWEKEAGIDETDPDPLAICYLTAKACEAQSKALPAKDPNRKRLTTLARHYAMPVANHPGEYQRPAKMMLVALAGAKDAKEGREGKEKEKEKEKRGVVGPTAFAEDLDRAKRALERMQAAADTLRNTQPADKAAIAAARKQKQASAAEALTVLHRALAESNAKTPAEDLNSARYYLCFLSWDAGQYYDAAVLGEFLASHYPDSLAGRQGARIALASFVRLHADSKSEDKSFETAGVHRVAEIIFKRWPDQEESDDAALTLLNLATGQQQADKVAQYLAKISVNSPRRGPAELRAGQALWSAYLRGSQALAPERPAQDKLDELKKRAQEILAQGLGRMEKAEAVDANLAGAAFTMAQICVESQRPDEAIRWLEDPRIGPLTLVRVKSPAVAREGFAIETYKMALRAYIGVAPQQIKKAEGVMDSLEKLVKGSGDAKAAENLTAIYIGLGRELQKHLQALRTGGKKKEMESVSKAFEIFLDRIAQREASGNLATINWVGETYFNMGTEFDEAGPALAPKAKEFFAKATKVYQRMLDAAEKDPKYREQPESLIPSRLRLADCYKRSGNFDEAIKQLRIVLYQKPMLITAQVQGAETFQARGPSNPSAYVEAINGGATSREGKKIIWGWAKLSKMTMNNPKFEETFHQARLSMAESRYSYAMAQEDKALRAKILEASKNDLWNTYKLFPRLGGETTTARYDRLLKTIQKGLGGKETGLAEFKERDAEGARAENK